MAADAELLIDRRRLRRRLSLWRVLGIGGLIVAVGALGYRVRAGADGAFAVGPQIARISVSGFIAGSEATAVSAGRRRRARSSGEVEAAMVVGVRRLRRIRNLNGGR